MRTEINQHNRHASCCRRCSTEMAALSSFPLAAVVTSRRRQEQRGKEAERQEVKQSEDRWWGKDEEGWKIATPNLCLLPPSPAALFPVLSLSSISALTSLSHPPVVAASSAAPSKVYEKEASPFLMRSPLRFQTAAASLAFSNTGKKWWFWVEELGVRVRKDPAWDSPRRTKMEEQKKSYKGNQTYWNRSHVRLFVL